MKAVVLWLAMNTSKEVNSNFSLYIVFFSICYQMLISDIDTFLLAFFIVSLDLISKVIKVLFMKAVVLKLATPPRISNNRRTLFPRVKW